MALSIAFSVFSNPINAHAGVFSFVNNLINNKVNAASSEEKSPNSQNLSLLEAAINMDPNPTKGGPDLSIVDDSALETTSGPSGTAHEVMEKKSTDKISVYTVRKGDSLGVIAQMFGVSQNTILWANDLNSSKDISPGDELIILPISGVKHTVKKGDTLKSIAKKYGVDSEEILSFNDLPENSALIPGDELIIPDGKEVSAPVIVKTGGSSSVKNTIPASNGYFIRPALGIKTQGLHGKYRSAVDIANSYGTAIIASASGKVVVAKMGGWNGGYGNYVVIEHSNGMQSLYAHLSDISISQGENVTQGTQIGKMGSTGRSTGSHLHFEILGSRSWNPFN